MELRWGTAAMVGALALTAGGFAQTHKVAKPEDVLRAVGVYEWTGDLAKPAASRLIPVSLFIDGKLQDAAVYLARPVPMALLTGNIYELDEAGIARGTVDLKYARHLQASEASMTTYDDGWFGYGTFVPPPAPKKVAALRPARTNGIVSTGSTTASASDRPHFSSKSATPGTGDAATPANGSAAPAADAGATAKTGDTPAGDPDRPTMKRRDDSSSTGSSTTASAKPATPATGTPVDDPDRPTMKRRSDSSTTASATPDSGSADKTASANSDSSAGDTPAGDPDRPTMKRRSDTSSPSTTSAGSSTADNSRGDAPADDPDRPTLRRRSPEDSKRAQKGGNDVGGVTGGGDSLNDDPNRPTLKRGKPIGEPKELDMPKLSGLPIDLHQMVAVSDAVNRPPHNFARAWESEDEHKDVLARMQAAARLQLAAYAAPVAPPAAPATPKRPTSKLRHGNTPAGDSAPVALLDEQLRGYTLSYGGAATYVYTAHTDGVGAAMRYVTVVAQVDMQGAVQVAMKSVTDAAHLDRTPRMQLVDVVDAEASNRASLLFEMRGETSRQFALYRIIGARADQVFATGTTQ